MAAIFYRLGPLESCPILKWLILLTLIVSLAIATIDPIYLYFYGQSGLEYLLGLSRSGISHFLIWQPLTYLFIVDAPYGFGLSFLISLAFSLYFLWIIGGVVCDRIGKMPFLYFYLISGMLAGLSALFFTPNFVILAGPWASLLALFTLWAMMAPESEVLLFFILPVKVKWIFAFVTGFILLNALSKLDFSSLVLYATSLLAGYLYGTIQWGFSSPFEFLYPLDRFCYRLKKWIPEKKVVYPTKIYDLRTGEPMMNDDQFVDAMLTKIAKHGEESLTHNEAKRLKEISDRKRNQF